MYVSASTCMRTCKHQNVRCDECERLFCEGRVYVNYACELFHTVWVSLIYLCVCVSVCVCVCTSYAYCFLVSRSAVANVHSSIVGGERDAGPHTERSWGFSSGPIKTLSSSAHSKQTAVEVQEDAVPHVARGKRKGLDDAQPHGVQDHLPGNCHLVSVQRREGSCGEKDKHKCNQYFALRPSSEHFLNLNI